MNNRVSLTYCDRYSGRLISEPVFAAPFLSWSYNTKTGRKATYLIFRQKFISKFYGWLHKRKFSRRKIKPFVTKMRINEKEFLRPIDDYRSFNDFFTREIDPGTRPINKDPQVCIAPADGRVLVYPEILPDLEIRIKRSTFNLLGFLRDNELVEKYSGGSMLVSRLYLTDYHHFHFPDSGIPMKALTMKGKYYAGSPYALRSLIPFYTENYRMLTLFESDHFGQTAIVEIGAFTVGSIKQLFKPGSAVNKGARKGYFELGGSTVVLLFEAGKIEFDSDLIQNTEREIETYVKLGDSIGRAVGNLIRR